MTLTYALQGWWAAALFGAMRFLFRVGLEVEGDEATAPGPMVLMMRHASLADTLLPTVLVLRRHKIRLRYVLKRELLWDPALDVAGNVLPNYFLDRRSTDAAAEVERVRALGVGLGERDGVLIYPEGTRFTPEKRERALEVLRRRFPHLVERAEALRGVLAPRQAGVLALLEAGTDVVVCAHVGLDGLSHVKRVWRGGLVGVIVRGGLLAHPGRGDPRRRRSAHRLALRPVAPGGRLGLRPSRRTVLRRTVSPGLVWFRADLRLGDNPAWDAATAAHEVVVALFVVDPALWEGSGEHRRNQLAGHLGALDRSLRDRGGRLRVRRGDPAGVVPAEAAAIGGEPGVLERGRHPLRRPARRRSAPRPGGPGRGARRPLRPRPRLRPHRGRPPLQGVHPLLTGPGRPGPGSRGPSREGRRSPPTRGTGSRRPARP